MYRMIVISILLASAYGCKKGAPAPKSSPESAASSPSDGAAPGSDHGSETKLGAVLLAGFTFEASALGAIAPGKDAAVAVAVTKSPAGKDWRTINLYAWVEDASGKKLSSPEKGRVEKGRLHAHVSVTSGTPATLILRVRDGAVDERAAVALTVSVGAGEGPKHSHDKTPHDGIVASVSPTGSGTPAAWLELKLHDDKGDLELWLTHDKAGAKPRDLQLDAKVSVSFIDLENRQVQLAPRNRKLNEDEDGTPNVRDGKTHYFIFPGESGADASWLLGKKFQSLVVVALESEGVKLRSEEFVLKPHTHQPGAEHK